MRPAMSLRGFDNSTISSSDPHRFKIYGVKQVLEKAYGIGQAVENSVLEVLQKISDEAQDSTITATSPGDVESNYSIMKSKAAYALLSYVVSKNDGDSGEPSIFSSGTLPGHAATRDDMLDFLKYPPTMYFPDHGESLTFKNVKAGMNLVQMWDMYLAYENACLYYETTTYCDSILLSYSEKQAWNDIIIEYVETIYYETRESRPFWFDVGPHEAQAGNWPLISFVGCGYMVMGFNGTFPLIYDPEDITWHSADDIMGNAYLSSYTTQGSGTTSRRYYHHYQTGGGQRYWAEGSYYYSITLEHLVPFYHALRANGKHLPSTTAGRNGFTLLRF